MKVQKLSTVARYLRLAERANEILQRRWHDQLGCISYGELNHQIPEMKHSDIGETLRVLTAHYKAEGLPLLTALVINPKTGRPSPGFFDTARELGYSIPNPESEETFWLWQIYHRLHLYGTTYEAQSPDTDWKAQAGVLGLLGYELEFTPLVAHDGVPNAQALRGRRLVEIKVKPTPQAEPPISYGSTEQFKSEVEALIFRGDPTGIVDGIERFRKLRKELQDLARERLNRTFSTTLCAGIPVGDETATSSQLPT